MARPSYFANWIPKLQAAGYSQNAAMRELRDAGHSFSDQLFRRVWAETIDHAQKSERIRDVPLNRKPSADQIGIATRPHARGYLYNVEIAVHDPETGEVSFHAWGIRTQKLISLGNALRRAVDSWTDRGLATGETYNETALGGFVSGVLNLVGPEETVGEDF